MPGEIATKEKLRKTLGNWLKGTHLRSKNQRENG